MPRQPRRLAPNPHLHVLSQASSAPTRSLTHSLPPTVPEQREEIAQKNMPVGIEAWVTQIPPVTRAWLALSVLTSIAVVSKLPLGSAAASTYSPPFICVVCSNARL